MDKITSSENLQQTNKKKRTNLILGLSIVVLLLGISVGMYILNSPEIFKPRASTDTFSRCGPPGHCNDYGWTDNKSYTKVPTDCYVALYKCDISKWDKVLAVGCQKNTSDPSKNTANYAEIHKLTKSNPNPKIWDKVVAGDDGNGHLKSFAPPQFCGIWQIDVGPRCNFSFHSAGNRRESICKVPPTKTPTPKPTKTPTPTISISPTPTPSNCPKPKAVINIKISCPICNKSQ